MQAAVVDGRLSDGMIAALPLRRRGASRARILAATRELLRSRSYDVLTMDAVADAARLTRRTIYHQFIGRQSLYRASRESLASSVAAGLNFGAVDESSAHVALIHIGRIALAALSGPDGSELLLSMVRDTEDHDWLVALFQSRCRAPVVAAATPWLSERSAHFAALLETLALAPCLADPAMRTALAPEQRLPALVDSILG